MKRVMIIGCAGSGKTTMAKEISRLIDSPAVHMDKILWTSDGWNWIKRTDLEIRTDIKHAAAKDRWVFEGDSYSNADLRIAHADTLIFLDMPTTTCLFRVIKRMIMTYNMPRDDLADGCRERFDWEFLKWIFNYRTTTMPKALKLLRNAPDHITVHHFQTEHQVRSFLISIENDVKD